MASSSSAPEWQWKVLIICIVTEIILHMVQMGLYGTPTDPLVGSPSILGAVAGAIGWITFTDLGMPWWAIFPIAMANLIMIGAIAWVIWLNIKDLVPSWA